MLKVRNRQFVFTGLIFVLFLVYSNAKAQSSKTNLNLFEDWVQWSNGENMLQLYINQIAFKQKDERESRIIELKTREDWLLRQEKMMARLKEITGDFPPKTPLNPIVTEKLQKNGYRIEKILYESMPGFKVTGALFIPEGLTGKTPAILNVIGHSMQAFRRDIYQDVIHNLVKKGFIVFAIDPISQGERIQYYDPEKGESVVGKSTHEHSYIGNQCLLNGYSVAKYFIWDGIRAIDYLATRKEVDIDRIGITGLSGGGTLSTYIGAFDDRIKASAPACYITSYKRILQSIGTQDGEQFFYHSLAAGIDHADLIELRAPKPTLLLAQSLDFFPIQGTMETYKELKTAYAALGGEDHINLVVDDYGHSQTKKTKEAIYAFFQKELNLPGDPQEEDIEILPEEELNITETGQLYTSQYDTKIVFDLNKKETEALLGELERSRKEEASHLENVLKQAKKLSGYMEPEEEQEVIYRGKLRRDGYAVEMYAINIENSYAIPVLLFVPENVDNSSAIIYIHPEGKIADADEGGRIEELVRKGFIVAAPDVLGNGETRSARTYPGDQSYNALLTGKSIPGIQASDISRVAEFLKNYHGANIRSITAVSFDKMCPALLHAAAFNKSIDKTILVTPPVSYGDIGSHVLYAWDPSFSWGVAGALTSYDLPDLAASLSPRKLLICNPLDHSKQPASAELIEEEYSFTRSVYQENSASENFKIRIESSDINKCIEEF